MDLTPCIPNFDRRLRQHRHSQFAKYYNFSSADARAARRRPRRSRQKAMPDRITCQAGAAIRSRLRTRAASQGSLVENLPSRSAVMSERGCTAERDSFAIRPPRQASRSPTCSPSLADFNQWILCTYPSPRRRRSQQRGRYTMGDCARPIAGRTNGRHGGGDDSVLVRRAGHAGPFSDTYVQPGGTAAPRLRGLPLPHRLYKNVVELTAHLHILRGTKNQDDINFFNYELRLRGSIPHGIPELCRPPSR